MNRRLSGILTIALLISTVATYLVYRVVTIRTSFSQRSQPAAQVIVAARQLEIGTIIKESDLKTTAWMGPIPKGMVTKKAAILGRGVIVSLYEGEPLMETRLAPAGAGGGLAATIPAGMRAAAVRVNDLAGVAGFAVPGMRVDVLINGNPPGGPTANGPRARTLLQNIQVLSAGQNYQKDAEGKPVLVPVVNLLVTPDQAEVLSLATNEARIQLVLRNPLDTKTAKTSGTALASLYGDALPAPIPRSRPVTMIRTVPAPKGQAPVILLPPYQVEVLNGSKRTALTFTRRMEEQQ